MSAIFFDLETTDLNQLGQILNYAFVQIDDDYNIMDKLTGRIDLDIYQLPSVGAINSNHIFVRDHLQGKYGSEEKHMHIIHNWLTDKVENDYDKTVLVGQNSHKFDVHYLRTSWVRNGLNPYTFGRNLLYTDTKFLSKKLYIQNTDFRTKVYDMYNRIFSLSNLTSKLNILEGEQQHEALADVMLTIDLAKCYQNDYNLNYLKYNAYEANEFKHEDGMVIWVDTIQHHGQIKVCPMVLLDHSARYSLWLNLDSLYIKDGKVVSDIKRSINWYHREFSSFIVHGNQEKELGEYEDIALQIFNIIENENPTWKTIEGFFDTPDCDVEHHIHKMSFPEMIDLYHAIEHTNPKILKDNKRKLAFQLFVRYMIKKDPKKFDELLKKYCDKRYNSGTIITNKDKIKPKYHWTLDDMFSELNEIKTKGDLSKQLIELENYYKEFKGNYL